MLPVMYWIPPAHVLGCWQLVPALPPPQPVPPRFQWNVDAPVFVPRTQEHQQEQEQHEENCVAAAANVEDEKLPSNNQSPVSPANAIELVTYKEKKHVENGVPGNANSFEKQGKSERFSQNLLEIPKSPLGKSLMHGYIPELQEGCSSNARGVPRSASTSPLPPPINADNVEDLEDSNGNGNIPVDENPQNPTEKGQQPKKKKKNKKSKKQKKTVEDADFEFLDAEIAAVEAEKSRLDAEQEVKNKHAQQIKAYNNRHKTFRRVIEMFNIKTQDQIKCENETEMALLEYVVANRDEKWEKNEENVIKKLKIWRKPHEKKKNKGMLLKYDTLLKDLSPSIIQDVMFYDSRKEKAVAEFESGYFEMVFSDTEFPLGLRHPPVTTEGQAALQREEWSKANIVKALDKHALKQRTMRAMPDSFPICYVNDLEEKLILAYRKKAERVRHQLVKNPVLESLKSYWRMRAVSASLIRPQTVATALAAFILDMMEKRMDVEILFDTSVLVELTSGEDDPCVPEPIWDYLEIVFGLTKDAK